MMKEDGAFRGIPEDIGAAVGGGVLSEVATVGLRNCCAVGLGGCAGFGRAGWGGGESWRRWGRFLSVGVEAGWVWHRLCYDGGSRVRGVLASILFDPEHGALFFFVTPRGRACI